MNRPSPWLAGAGFGFVTWGVILLAVAFGYLPSEPWWYPFTTAIAVFGLPVVWEWIFWRDRDRAQPETAPTVTAPRFQETVVNGRQPGLMLRYQPATLEEQEWYSATVHFLMWARWLGSLSSPKHLQAGSVKTPQQWMDVTDPLAAYGAIIKESGKETRYVSNWDSTRLLTAVENGLVKWDLDKPAPKISPFPGSAALERAGVPGKAKALEAA